MGPPPAPHPPAPAEETLGAADTLRDEPPTSFLDRAFENEINIAVARTAAAYDRMLFRAALKAGWYDLSRCGTGRYREGRRRYRGGGSVMWGRRCRAHITAPAAAAPAAGLLGCCSARDVYRFACGPDGGNRRLLVRYIEVSTLLLAPVCPHTAEHIWGTLLKRPGLVLTGAGVAVRLWCGLWDCGVGGCSSASSACRSL